MFDKGMVITQRSTKRWDMKCGCCQVAKGHGRKVERRAIKRGQRAQAARFEAKVGA